MLTEVEYTNNIITPFLYNDGSWRDIYVLKTSRTDWFNFLAQLKNSDYQFDFLINGKHNDLSANINSLFDYGTTKLLRIRIDKIYINCHFFSEDQLEFDLNPADFVAFEQHDELINFMRFVSNSVSKPCYLTPENMEGIILVEVKPNEQPIWVNKNCM